MASSAALSRLSSFSRGAESADSRREAYSPLGAEPQDLMEEDEPFQFAESGCCGCEHPARFMSFADTGKGLCLLFGLIGFSAAAIALQGFMASFLTLLPLWCAAVLTLLGSMCMPTMKPNLKWIIFWLPLVFLGELGFFRGYAVACRRQWKEQLVLKEEAGQIRVFSETALTENRTAHDLYNCADGFEFRDEWDSKKKLWCCVSKSIGCGERRLTVGLEAHHSVGPPPERQAGREDATAANVPGISIVANDRDWTDVDDHVLEAYCDIEQNKDFGKELPVLRRCATGHGAGSMESTCARLLNWTCPPWTCMFTAQHAHGAYRFFISFMVSVLVSGAYTLNPCHSHLAHRVCGFGEYHEFVAWYWVVYVPTFGIQAATYMKGVDYGDIIASLFEIFQVVMKDAYMASMTAGCFLLFLIIACNWSKIKSSLGLDDSAFVRLVHLGDMCGFQLSSNLGEFQICVFRVEATAKEVRSSPAPALGSHMLSGLWTTSHNLERHIPGINRPYNMYVRIGYGENAPQQSRVVSGTRLMADTRVNFRQAFNLNRMNGLNEAPLFITVRNQEVVSSQQLGRVIFDPHHLKSMLDEASAREAQDWQEHGRQGDSLAVRQLSGMLKSQPNRADLRALGFQWFPLDQGGSIVVAFAPAPT